LYADVLYTATSLTTESVNINKVIIMIDTLFKVPRMTHLYFHPSGNPNKNHSYISFCGSMGIIYNCIFPFWISPGQSTCKWFLKKDFWLFQWATETLYSDKGLTVKTLASETHFSGELTLVSQENVSLYGTSVT